jgi:hypothetical protein
MVLLNDRMPASARKQPVIDRVGSSPRHGQCQEKTVPEELRIERSIHRPGDDQHERSTISITVIEAVSAANASVATCFHGRRARRSGNMCHGSRLPEAQAIFPLRQEA